MRTPPTYNRRKSNIFLNFKQFFFAGRGRTKACPRTGTSSVRTDLQRAIFERTCNLPNQKTVTVYTVVKYPVRQLTQNGDSRKVSLWPLWKGIDAKPRFHFTSPQFASPESELPQRSPDTTFRIGINARVLSSRRRGCPNPLS